MFARRRHRPFLYGRAAIEAAAPDAVAMGARVRLARNLEGERFPDWATTRDRARVRDAIFRAIGKARLGLRVQALETAPEASQRKLMAAHLLSADLLARGPGAGYAIDPEAKRACILVNEEDHLRIQAFAPACELENAWRIADGIDSRLDAELPFAWSPQLGYLTACPSNLGTAMRASVRLHLAALGALGEIEQVLNGFDRLRVAVRGLDGEGSDAPGCIYQISNIESLGCGEREIIDRIGRIAASATRLELNARARLANERRALFEDCLTRAYALLSNARLLTFAEAYTHLSMLRMGREMGAVRENPPGEIERLMRAACEERELDDEERALDGDGRAHYGEPSAEEPVAEVDASMRAQSMREAMRGFSLAF